MNHRVSRRRLLGGLALLMPISGVFLQACSGGSSGNSSSGDSVFLATPIKQTTPAPAPSPVPTLARPTTVATVSPRVTPTAAATAKATPAASTSGKTTSSSTGPIRSIQVFLWGSGTAARDLNLAKEAGFTWIKQGVQWRYVEPHKKGVFEFNEPDRLVKLIEQTGLKFVARVDNQPVWARSDKVFPIDGPPDKVQDFADFLHAFASRYKGKVHAYEIWNEPNLAREWGNQPPNPQHYVELLKAGYEAIKAADPQAQVLSAGLAPTTASGAIAMPDIEFITQMYKAGADKYFDALGAHGAGYKAPPEMSPDAVAKDPKYDHGEPGAGRIYCFRHIEDVRKVMVENGDAKKSLAILEFGWTTDRRANSPYAWFGVTPDQQAQYLTGAYTWAQQHWQPWIGLMSMIYICAPYWTPNDEEYYWSITNPDGTVRPAYQALAAQAAKG